MGFFNHDELGKRYKVNFNIDEKKEIKAPQTNTDETETDLIKTFNRDYGDRLKRNNLLDQPFIHSKEPTAPSLKYLQQKTQKEIPTVSQEFKNAIAQKESGKDGYSAYNPSGGGIGALGKYQLRSLALQDAGYLDKNNQWTGKK